jgi:hypothetical protein
MSPPRFTPEFKDEVVRQITERGYSVAEASARLGVSPHRGGARYSKKGGSVLCGIPPIQ